MWRKYPIHSSLSRLPYLCLSMLMIKWYTYSWRCKSRNGWPSINTHFEYAVESVSLPVFTIQAANTAVMTGYNQSPTRLPIIHDEQLFMLPGRPFSGCCRVWASVFVDHHGSKHIQNSQPHTNVNIVRLTVAYLHVTLNCDTRNPQPEIGTKGSSQTHINPWVDGYFSGFGPRTGSGSGLWLGLGLQQPVFVVQTRTTGRLHVPVGNTSLDSLHQAFRQSHPKLLKESTIVNTVSHKADLSSTQYFQFRLGAIMFICHQLDLNAFSCISAKVHIWACVSEMW